MAARPVQRQHQLAPQPLPIGMLADEPLEIADHRRVAAQRQLRVDPPLHRADVQLFQAGDLRLRERVVPKVAQRWPPPQRQRVAQPPGPELPVTRRARPSAVLHQPLEPIAIELAVRHPDQVAAPGRDDPPLLPERAPQPRDVRVQARRRARGWLSGPQLLHQSIPRDDLVGMQQQDRQHRTLRAPAQHQAATPVVGHLQRAEDPKAHRFNHPAAVSSPASLPAAAGCDHPSPVPDHKRPASEPSARCKRRRSPCPYRARGTHLTARPPSGPPPRSRPCQHHTPSPASPPVSESGPGRS